jgi:tetratricopeptide (TPR) repeat protein
MITNSKIYPEDNATATPTPTTTTTTTSFAHYGVKFAYIAEFVSQIGGRDAVRPLATYAVKDHVLQLTATTQLSLCEQLYRQGSSMVGHKADWFISHAWGYKFLEVFDAVEAFLLKTYSDKDQIGDIVIWFDLFSNCQHNLGAVDLPFNWWKDVFASAVGDIGKVCMVLQPWDAPDTLKRAWCIFEVYATVSTNSVFQVALTQQQSSNFLETMVATKGDCFYDMLGKVRSEHSIAKSEYDARAIHDTIRKEIPNGFIGLDSMIFRVMEKWMTGTIEETIEVAKRNGNVLEATKFELLLSILLRKQSVDGATSVEKNLQRAQRCVEVRKKLLGSDHVSTAEAMVHLGRLYSDARVLDKAESLLVFALQVLRQQLGEGHSETLLAVNMLASMYSKAGRFHEAETLLLDCIRQQDGENDKNKNDSNRCLNNDQQLSKLSYEHNLANLYGDQRRYADAEDTYVRVIGAYRAKLGEDHHDTLVATNNLAVTYIAMSRLQDAEKLLLACMRGRERTLGRGHSDTITAMYNLSSLYMSMGRYGEAEKLAVECVDRRTRSLGVNHPECIGAMIHLASVHRNQGRFKECEEELVKCFHDSGSGSGSGSGDEGDFMVIASSVNELGWSMENKIINHQQNQSKDVERLLLWSISEQERVHARLRSQQREDRIDYTAFIEAKKLLAVHYASGIQAAAAAKYIQEAEELCNRVNGPDHSISVALSLTCASILHGSGRSEEAKTMLLRCLDVKRRTMGDSHPETIEVLDVMESFANYYERRGEFKEAEQVLKTCLNLRNQLVGDNHPSYVATLDRVCAMAAACADGGEKALAERLLKEVWHDCKRLLGGEHPKTLEVVHKLGSLYTFSQWQEKYGYALEIMLDCLHSRESSLGPRHLDTAATLHVLAQLYQLEDKLERAQPYYASCLESKEQVLVPYHPDLIITVEALAKTQYFLEDFSSSEKYFKRAIAMRADYKEKIQDKRDTADELTSLYFLGSLYKDKRDYVQAKATWEDCLQRRKVLLGDDEPDTKELAQELEELLRDMKSAAACCILS